MFRWYWQNPIKTKLLHYIEINYRRILTIKNRSWAGFEKNRILFRLITTKQGFWTGIAWESEKPAHRHRQTDRQTHTHTSRWIIVSRNLLKKNHFYDMLIKFWYAWKNRNDIFKTPVENYHVELNHFLTRDIILKKSFSNIFLHGASIKISSESSMISGNAVL